MAPELNSLLRILGCDRTDIRRILVSIDAPRAARAARDDGETDQVPKGGDLLRALRRRKRLTLPEVAASIGASPSTISRWEGSLTHPSVETLSRYLDWLGASDEEKRTLLATGVGKIKSDRPEFSYELYANALDGIEAGLDEPGDASAEIRLLQIQSNLWWERQEPGALDLLRRSYVAYGRYLLVWVRLDEAMRQSAFALEISDGFDALGIEARRIQAVAAAYRSVAFRPHEALCILQPCLQHGRSSQDVSRVLIDMADFSWMAGRGREGASYAERAIESIGSQPSLNSDQAEGAFLASNGDSNGLASLRRGSPWPEMLIAREVALLTLEGWLDDAERLVSEGEALAEASGRAFVPDWIYLVRKAVSRKPETP